MTNKEIVKQAIRIYALNDNYEDLDDCYQNYSLEKKTQWEQIVAKFHRECKEGGWYPRVIGFNSQTFSVGYWCNSENPYTCEFVYITKTYEYRYKPTYDKVIKIKR